MSTRYAKGIAIANYAKAVAWIAENDEPTWDWNDREAVSEMISVALVADIFGRRAIDVACDVLEARFPESREVEKLRQAEREATDLRQDYKEPEGGW